MVKESVVECFDEAQRGIHCHGRVIQKMKQLRQENYENFCRDFIAALRHVLIVFKHEASVERLVDFVSNFATDTVGDDDEHEDSTNEKDNSKSQDSNDFLIMLLQYLLSINQAQDRGVRYRSCQLVCKLLNNLGADAQIDDDLYTLIYESMMERLYDKIPTVRVQAVRAVGRLQDPNNDQCPVIEKYLELMSKDSSPDVRRSVLVNIAITSSTLPIIIQRTKDVKENVRRVAYLVLAERVGIKSLTISQRLELLENGLKDRCEGVRQICKNKLLINWLTSFNGHIIALLQHLDVENATKTVEMTLNILFHDIPVEDLIGQIVVDEDNVVKYGKATLPSEKSLASEMVVYWRCLTQYLNSIGSNGDEYLDRVLPELSNFCQYIASYIALPFNKDDEEEVMVREFTIEQLLLLAGVMDLTDEVGRKNLCSLLKARLTLPDSSLRSIPVVVGQFQKLTPDSKNYVSAVSELIADLRHPLVSSRPKHSVEEIRQLEIKIASLRVQINEKKEDLKQCVIKEDFTTAGNVKSSITNLENQKLELEADCNATELETLIVHDESELIYRCLLIAREMLANLTDVPSQVNSTVEDLMDSLILPGIQDEDPVIRRVAVECLTLCCVLNKNRARNQLLLFLQIMQVDQVEVRQVALQAAFDLLHVFGFEICSESNKEQHEVEEGDEEANEDNSEASGKLLTILTSFLDSPISELRQVAAEGLAKLLLSGRISSPKLISRLLLLWYNPTSEDDLHLRHCLGVFFPTYALNCSANQQMLLEAFIPTLRTIADAPENSALHNIDVNNVTELVTQLTSFQNLQAHQGEQSRKGLSDDVINVHDELAVKVLNEILSDNEGSLTRTWCRMLNSLSIDKLNVQNIKMLIGLLNEALEIVKDKISIRALKNFKQSVDTNDGSHEVGEGLNEFVSLNLTKT